MTRFKEGKYLGTIKNEIFLNGIILSETIYQQRLSSEWHTHDNPYFAFVLNGGCLEQRQKESIECTPGKLFFYNWEQPHRNLNYQSNSRIFNIELNNGWLNAMDIKNAAVNGITTVNNPTQKFILLRIFKAYRFKDKQAELDIELLTIQLLSSLINNHTKNLYIPNWVTSLREILHDCWQDNFSLKELSEILKLHPVTISKYFSKYFNCTLGEYVRRIKIDKSLSLIRMNNENLASIAYACGFADQSHFIRMFKKETGLLPHHYKAF